MMDAIKIEVKFEDMTFSEFIYDVKNMGLILKLISQLSLESLDKRQNDAYSKLDAYLEENWNRDLKLLTSPERGYELYSRKYRKRLMADLRKTHNILRSKALTLLNNEMQKSFSKNAIELNNIIINKWKNRYEEMLRRSVELDDYNLYYLNQLVEDLKFQSKRILWVYQDKAFAQFDLFQKRINLDIEACKV